MKTILAPLSALLLALPNALDAADSTWLQPPQYVGSPKPEHAVTNRAFQGIPSMAIVPKGRLWSTWYAGVTPGEDENNYVALSTSGDDGKTWQEALIIEPDADGPVRGFDPQLWVSPDARLFVFWTQAVGHTGTVAGVWCMETAQPDAAAPVWSKPRRVTDGVMMGKPLVLSTGEWVLPASTWRETDNSARLIVSTDKGASWSLRGGCNVPKEARQFDEHMLIERRDGSLWMLARTKYGIGESVSTDGGRTWPELRPAAIPHADARFFIRRLDSGSLLLVKHGGLDQPVTVRSHLTAYVSKDEGQTWTGGLMLDERKGVSYPDGQQTPDGLIRIIYDHGRVGRYRQILMASFHEEDALAGKAVSGAVKLRQVVSQASGGKDTDQNKDGVPIKVEPAGMLACEGVQAEPLTGGVRLFNDRNYTLTQGPPALPGAHFLPVPMNGEKSLRCTRAGNVWCLTPTLKRNKDSQTERLLKQGFKKAAVPEVRLFLPRAEGSYEFATLYQKDCQNGELIIFGKWAVPVFLP